MGRHGQGQVDQVNGSEMLVDGEDFVFRFKIEGEENIMEQPFEELFQGTILEMLKYITFFDGRNEVHVTGFAFRNNPDKIYGFCPEKSE